jgi:hypothetical protein
MFTHRLTEYLLIATLVVDNRPYFLGRSVGFHFFLEFQDEFNSRICHLEE